jgi:hypothetical protein
VAAAGDASTTRPIAVRPSAQRGAIAVFAALHHPTMRVAGPLASPDPWYRLQNHDDQPSVISDDECGQANLGGATDTDEVERLHRRWLRWGAPGLERLGLTITATGAHRIWLDQPIHVIADL